MGRWSDTVDLARYSLSSGEGRRLDLEARPGRFMFGGQAYEPAGGSVRARLDVSRTASGFALRLRFVAPVRGPCVRCLAESDVAVEVDAREVDQPGSGDEELRSPYVRGAELDLAGWAHDALALAMPERFLCRPDCAGLCAVCGVSLNEVDPSTHSHEPQGDPRWERLRELKLE
jgi:uncharacterized protein